MMFRSILSNQRLPLFAGVALGGAGAMYFSQRSAKLQAEAPGALDPNTFTPLPLLSTKFLSKDTKELVFDLPKDHSLGGKTAYVVVFKHQGEDGKPIVRPYTPISEPDTLGSATFVIKAYPSGKLTPYLHSLKAGDTVDVKGPFQKFVLQPNQHKKIALIGGGTGITPLFQVLQSVANDPKDKTQVSLYYGSNTPEDVLLKSEIDALVSKKPDQLKVVYFAAKAGNDWKGEKGFITKDYLQKQLFKPSEDNVRVFVCGPPPLYEAISGKKPSPTDQGELTGALKELGFSKDQVFKY